MRIFEDFRRGIAALERIATTQSEALRRTQADSGSTERITDLERSRALFEADMEGLLAKAEGKLKAASNAEARERTMRKSYEEIDPFNQESIPLEAPTPGGDVEGGETDGLPPVRMDLAPNSKAYALRAKYS